MALGPQTLKVTTFQKHLLKRKQKRKGRRRAMLATLTLTSMVDMFSLLVIFLLQAFSASPELVMVSKGVTLPAAVSGHEITDAPVLSITSDTVYLDQQEVGPTQQLLENPEPLTKRLADLRTLWQTTHPKEQFKGEINLQAHKDLPSPLVSRFMAILPTQFYSTVQLAVVSREN